MFFLTSSNLVRLTSLRPITDDATNVKESNNCVANKHLKKCMLMLGRVHRTGTQALMRCL